MSLLSASPRASGLDGSHRQNCKQPTTYGGWSKNSGDEFGTTSSVIGDEARDWVPLPMVEYGDRRAVRTTWYHATEATPIIGLLYQEGSP